MLTKGKRRVAALVLMVAIMATMLAGFASAAETSVASTNATYYSFWMDAPGAGKTDTATLRTKESSLSYAYYNLTTVSNSTGKEAYINVRAYDKVTKAGTAAVLSGTGSYSVYYLSGYGNVGSSYCPSSQTSTSSSSSGSVYISGTWRP